MKFAIIENGICVNVIIASAEYAGKIGAVPLQDGFGIGDLYDNGVWVHPEPEPQPEPSPTVEERLDTVETEVDEIAQAIERGLSL